MRCLEGKCRNENRIGRRLCREWECWNIIWNEGALCRGREMEYKWNSSALCRGRALEYKLN